MRKNSQREDGPAGDPGMEESGGESRELEAHLTELTRRLGLTERERAIVLARTRGRRRKDFLDSEGIAGPTYDRYADRIKARTGRTIEDLAFWLLREAPLDG